jgi:hypothetical protein
MKDGGVGRADLLHIDVKCARGIRSLTTALSRGAQGIPSVPDAASQPLDAII